VTFIHGDVWNVNPIALKRVERLFCKNERAVLETRLSSGEALTLVPVAAILVASIRLHFLDRTLNAQTRGPTMFPCEADVHKGDELGWFEHGSTIIVLAPEHFEFADNVAEGARVRAITTSCRSSAPANDIGGGDGRLKASFCGAALDLRECAYPRRCRRRR
jgi:phosphatidylserine decarboxylase